jgi:aquaporin Z
MMGKAFPDTVSRTAAVAAPALMVLAVILFMGRVSGAHLNPAVSVAFALRGDFPWRRVPGYVVVQLAGAVLAVGVAFVLRGPGGGRSGSTAAQGALFTDVKRPDRR